MVYFLHTRVARRAVGTASKVKTHTERADPAVAKVYMYAPVAVNRECAGRHPRHHAQGPVLAQARLLLLLLLLVVVAVLCDAARCDAGR